MKQEEEFSNNLEKLEQLITKFYIHETQYRMDRAETQAAIDDIKNDLENYVKSCLDIENLLVGSITAFAMDTPPDGWLICDGTAVSRTKFDRLFKSIGETFGSGDGSSTFNLPDLEGRFVRGWSAEGKLDCMREFGSYQSDQMQSHKHDDLGHKHKGKTKEDGEHGHRIRCGEDDGDDWGLVESDDVDVSTDDDYIRQASAIHNHKFTTDTAKAILGDPTDSHTGAGETRHGDETRVKNLALRYCIKY